jgi:hypothetical protein
VTTILGEDAVYWMAARGRRRRARLLAVERAGLLPGGHRQRPATAPVPLRPIGDAGDDPTPALLVRNATDPEGDPLTYRFEIDERPELDSPDRQESPELGAGPGETEWPVPAPLRENTLYYWRAHASDGNTATPSALASFFVNVANEAPGAPVPLDPVDGAQSARRHPPAPQVPVDRTTPDVRGRGQDAGDTWWRARPESLRPPRDAWTVDAAGRKPGVRGGPVPARRPAGPLERPRFRVDAVASFDIPSPPPARGRGGRRGAHPSLVVENATSPDALTPPTPSARIRRPGRLGDGGREEGIPETPETTA